MRQDASTTPRALDRLWNLGVTPGISADLIVALRAVNFLAVAMAIVSAGGIVMALTGHGSAEFALGVALCLAAYVCILFVNGTGLHDVARFGFLAIGCLHWLMLSLALGPGSSCRFFLVAFVIYPLTAFTDGEPQKRVVAYFVIATTFVAGQLLTYRFGPLVQYSASLLERGDYFILASLAALCGFGIRHYQRTAASARLGLDDAHRRIAELLANVLPAPLAARLERQGGPIADSHGEATVLFADLSGFSALARRLSPSHLVEILDAIFTRCDEAAARHGVEKIKTIGDCYMAATGVLAQVESVAAVEAMADFGIAVLGVVESAADEIGVPLGVRIGISTGSLISGVIGRQKYCFDVWGDTVNLAARMQEAGVVGRIQVSETTYHRVRQAFDFETRGVIPLKGDHHATAYLLVGRKQSARLSENASADSTARVHRNGPVASSRLGA